MTQEQLNQLFELIMEAVEINIANAIEVYNDRITDSHDSCCGMSGFGRMEKIREKVSNLLRSKE